MISSTFALLFPLLKCVDSALVSFASFDLATWIINEKEAIAFSLYCAMYFTEIYNLPVQENV